jgi:hypothetical protein
LGGEIIFSADALAPFAHLFFLLTIFVRKSLAPPKQYQVLTRAGRLSQWFDSKLFPEIPLALMDDSDVFVENPQEPIK